MAVPMNSDEDDASAMKALAKEHDLSIRGAIATKPPFSYMRAFFDAMMDPHDADANPRGYINLAVAQNHLTIEPVQYRLRQSFVDAPLPDSACGYDNMRGSERLRVAIAKHETRMFGGDVSPEQLCVSAGAGAVIDNLFMAIASEGDGVLIPAPYYPAFDNDLRVRNGVRAIAVHGNDAVAARRRRRGGGGEGRENQGAADHEPVEPVGGRVHASGPRGEDHVGADARPALRRGRGLRELGVQL